MTTFGIIGGSGALGFGLAVRFALAGQSVVVGSRRAETATDAAAKLAAIASQQGRSVDARGLVNTEAAAASDVVILAVPFAQQDEAIDAIAGALAGKILVDTTVPLMPPKVGTVQLPPEGCSALRIQKRVGGDVKVVSAFQNVAADKLQALQPLDCDVLVSGDDKDARQTVVAAAESIGLRAFHAGPLANAAAAEALTSVLITINRQFKCHAGIRLTGLEG
jgi:NADPH-dependent F420 reductase